MNNYGFHFAESYQGFWNVSQIGRKIPGTLYIEKHSISLKLFGNILTINTTGTVPVVIEYNL